MSQYQLFLGDLPALLRAIRKTDRDLENFDDYRKIVNEWIRSNTPPIRSRAKS